MLFLVHMCHPWFRCIIPDTHVLYLVHMFYLGTPVLSLVHNFYHWHAFVIPGTHVFSLVQYTYVIPGA
jgi:hypothetical protein